MKLALCQLDVTDNKASNLHCMREMLLRAREGGAQMALLPEMFNIAYNPSLFAAAAEPCPGGESAQMLSEAAKETGMFIVGGSVPELSDGRVYNTSMGFDAKGSLLGKYRKAHLFDIDIPGVFRFAESDTITQGDTYPLILDAPMKTGVAICYDIRFPEWSRLMMQQDADLIALPAAFSMSTGPRHWELLLRARALDNQVFVAAVSPAHTSTVYGHSMLTSPDGTVLADCGEEECCRIVELDPALLETMRRSIPVRAGRRLDLYRLSPEQY